MKDFFRLSFNSLKRRRLRSWLTMLGIFIGIAAVVSLISLGQGLQNAITGQFDALDVDTLTVTNAETGFGPPGSTAIKKLTENDLRLIESVKGVKLVIPRLIRPIKVEYNKIANFYYATNLPQEERDLEIMYETLNVDILRGNKLEVDDKGKILLGNDFAENEFFGKEIRIGSKIKIQDDGYRVAGFLEKSGSFTLNSVVFMIEEDMKDTLEIGDEFDLIVVRVENMDKIEDVAEDIEKKLRKDRNLDLGEEDFSVQTPAQTLESVNTILNVVNLIVSGIAMISLIVGGIGIMNTMYTSVLERTKEIGTMKAVGAKNSDILLLFLIEAGLLGLVGGIIGALIGAGFAFGVSLIANTFLGNDILVVKFSLPLILGAISFSFFVGMASGFFPSLQASKLKPAEALRG